MLFRSPATSTVPLYWYRPPQRLSADAGVRRFHWDLRYQSLGDGGAGRGGLSIQAIPASTAPSTGTPLVTPGTYTVKLTVNGASQSQTMTVKQDPRVKTPALVLQNVYSLINAVYFGAIDARAAQDRAQNLRSQTAARLQTAGAAVKTSLEAFDKKLDGIAGAVTGGGGRGGGPAGRGGGAPAASPETLAGVAASLGGLVNALGSADVQPTANQVSAISTARAAAARVMTRWRAIETVDLAALNAALKGAGVEPIK